MAVVTLLGVAQDGGRPQPGCIRQCCQGLTEKDRRSLGEAPSDIAASSFVNGYEKQLDCGSQDVSQPSWLSRRRREKKAKKEKKKEKKNQS